MENVFLWWRDLCFFLDVLSFLRLLLVMGLLYHLYQIKVRDAKSVWPRKWWGAMWIVYNPTSGNFCLLFCTQQLLLGVVYSVHQQHAALESSTQSSEIQGSPMFPASWVHQRLLCLSLHLWIAHIIVVLQTCDVLKNSAALLEASAYMLHFHLSIDMLEIPVQRLW